VKLCLDSLTLTDCEPVDLIHAAGETGFDLVSLWVQAPALYPRALLTQDKARACEMALKQSGIRVGPLEVFDLSSPVTVTGYRPALELGARLGAKTASAINVSNGNPTQTADLFALFAEMARECGLGVTIEPLARFATRTLAQARELIRLAGVNAGIVFDIHHLMRENGSVQDVRANDPTLIWHAQLCDGPATVAPEAAATESWQERLYPGDGEFPLREVFAVVPTNISWGIEAPSLRRAKAGMSAGDQAKEAMAAVRRTIEKIPAALAQLGR
jgi:sugar phosphate isomerase/epimerase